MNKNANQGRFCSKAAFTLIELLVVVLIIGILAAVAVPQYQKAVEKSRITKALTVMDSVKKSMDVWVLENGYPAAGNYLFLWPDSFVEDNAFHKAEATIDAKSSLDCSDYCTDGTFLYEAMCTPVACTVTAYRGEEALNTEGNYWLSMGHRSATNQWTYSCAYYDDASERICNSLSGWTVFDGSDF